MRDSISGTTVNPKSVGIGVSQLLPIIASAFVNGYQLHIVEQPELHLHPSLQKKIPFIFIKSYMESENTYIVETHSEHIVRAFQLEIAKYKASGGESGTHIDNLAIYYVSRDKTGNSKIKRMHLDENGDFTEPWPDDFFDSASDLTLERLRILSKGQSN